MAIEDGIHIEIEQSKTDLLLLRFLAILLFSFISYFLAIYYPQVSDGFDFWHMAIVIQVERLGHIDPSYPNSGYYLATAIMSIISGIDADTIPTLPLQSIPFILLLFIIMKNISFGKSIIPLIILSGIILTRITKFDNYNEFGWWSHGIGIILALTVIYLVIIRISSDKGVQMTSPLLILLIFALNFVSYKMTAFSLIIILSLQIINWIETKLIKERENIKNYRLGLLFLIGIIYVGTFNNLLYDEFIPRIRIASEMSTSFLSFWTGSHRYPLLQEFSRHVPADIRYATNVIQILILIGLAFVAFRILWKFSRRRELLKGEEVLLGMMLADAAILLIYSNLGTFDVVLLVFTGLFSFPILVISDNKSSRKYQSIVVLGLSIILVLNVYVSVRNLQDGFYEGVRDENFCQYLKSPSSWYIKHIIYPGGSAWKASTDVFTGGYIAKEIAKINTKSTNAPDFLSYDDISLLLRHNISFSELYGDRYFIINKALQHFWIGGWNSFGSWKLNNGVLDSNILINKIYSSNDADIYGKFEEPHA